MIRDNQYKFFKFCLETGDLKSERQREYFTKAVEEYEIENGLNEEQDDYENSFWWDFMELFISGLIFGATLNYMTA
jgi:hypothetical protein